MTAPQAQTFDYIIIGSGFGGSVSAMRLTEKGYRVLVLERGRHYRDEDFATSNWAFWKYLWLPALRCFGILELSPLRDVLVLRGSGVGGGSLGYAGVLIEPEDSLFEAPAWRHLADWKRILRPHYETARRMLGVAANPRLWTADHVLKEIAEEMGREESFRPVDVGTCFGPEGEEVPDPYFDGRGPPRRGCTHCGACMVGCRHNAKNTLVKNYLHFAMQGGAEIRAESEASDIRPLPEDQADGARYEVRYHRSTNPLRGKNLSVRARNVVVSAGVLGTLGLLFRCRGVTRSLPRLSPRLGDLVCTNNEALLGAISRENHVDYSQGISITSTFHPDEVTRVEPVRYPAGSSLMRLLSAPLVGSGARLPARFLKVVGQLARHPVDALRMLALPGWASRTTILLVMQTVDTHLRIGLGRSPLSPFRPRLVSHTHDGQPIPTTIPIGHDVTRAFARKTNGIPSGSITESLLDVPVTAHILGGCPFGRSREEGVVDLDCQVFGYPGLYVVDSSIMPANPGVNPSLTATALAEYAMSHIPEKQGI